MRFLLPSILLGSPEGVKHVPRATHTWNLRKLIEHLLVVVILLGLVYLVYWVITEEPRPRYPGIEKLRGHSGPDQGPFLTSVVPDAATFPASHYPLLLAGESQPRA